MRNKYTINKEFKKWAKFNPPITRGIFPLARAVLRCCYWAQKSTNKTEVTKFRLPVDTNTSVRTILFSPKGLASDAPCLIYFHGGGFVFSAAPYHYRLARSYCEMAGCKVLLVDYRLAPKYPCPIPIEDCYATYVWLVGHAADFGVDAGRIAVGGDSAGGALATAVCLMARDRGQSMPCAQMLIYPVTGIRVQTPSMLQYVDTPMCNSRDIKKYEKFYLARQAALPAYASPLHADSLKGLPQTYIETAEFDCLRDGATLFADKLERAGVRVELNQTVGTMHGFDMVAKSLIVHDCVTYRVRFLLNAFESPNIEEPFAQ